LFINPGRAQDNGGDFEASGNHQYRHDHALYLEGIGNVIRNNVFYGSKYGAVIACREHNSDTGGLGVGEFSHYIVNNTFGPNVGGSTATPGSDAETYGEQSGNHLRVSGVLQAGDSRCKVYCANNIGLGPTNRSDRPGMFSKHPTYNTSDHACINNIATIGDCDYSVEWPAESSDFAEYANNLHQQNIADLDMTDPDNFVYSIGASSIAINHGDPNATYAPTEDFLGNPRSGNPDAGAFEYIP